MNYKYVLRLICIVLLLLLILDKLDQIFSVKLLLCQYVLDDSIWQGKI